MRVSSAGMDVTYDFGLIRSIYGFAVGVACFRLLRARGAGAPGRHASSLFEALAAGGAVWFVAAAGKSNASLAAPLVFGAVICVYAHDGGALSRWLQVRPLQWVGKLSYSIYLNHYVLMITLVPSLGYWLRQRFALAPGELFQPDAAGLLGRSAAEGNLYLLGFMALTFGVSGLTFRWVEQPARRWSRQWAARWRAPPPRGASYQ
jgi:peptidoglycan/LPS O-acetylase OafA/YrhL